VRARLTQGRTEVHSPLIGDDLSSEMVECSIISADEMLLIGGDDRAIDQLNDGVMCSLSR
jgi:hypothetical protein